MRELKASHSAGICPGEGAFFMAEQLGFDQARSESRTITDNERTIAPCRSSRAGREPALLFRCRFRP